MAYVRKPNRKPRLTTLPEHSCLPGYPEIRYREVAGFFGYLVGSNSTFWSCLNRRGRITRVWHQIFGSITTNGRCAVDLSREIPGDRRRGVSMLAHRVVLEAFVGPCPDGMECRHLDNNPLNNSLSNICWGTPIENMADKKVHGTEYDRRGSANPKAKLSEKDIPVIRRLRHEGIMPIRIAAMFNVDPCTVTDITKFRTWKHIDQTTLLPDVSEGD